MKRAAAIIGPTPSFVRWAIRFDCNLRQLNCENLPYDTFRQLRSVRELSIGRIQHRVVNGFCIHPKFNLDTETARGFPESEVFELFGDPQQIAENCNDCPANACFSTDNTESWAGCFGWFFSQCNNNDWIERFEHGNCVELSEIPESGRIWYRVWQIRQWNQLQLRQLCELLEHVLRNGGDNELVRFHQAVKACLSHRLQLHTELVPQGHSDGIHWLIEPCCSICRCELHPKSRGCQECGAEGPIQPAQKRKVLGLRPYMILRRLIGETATRDLINEFHANSIHNRSSG